MRLAANDYPASSLAKGQRTENRLVEGRRDAIRVSVFHSPGEAKARWPEFEPSAMGALYSTFDWSSAWQSTVGAERGVEPFVLVAEDGQGPLLALNLGIEREGNVRVARFMGHGHNNQNTGLWSAGFLENIDPAPLRTLVADTAKAYGVDLLDLRNMPLIIDRFQNPLLIAEDRPSHTPVYSFLIIPDFDTLYRARRSAPARKKLKAKERKLRDAGTFRIARAEDETTALAWLDTLFAQRAARAQSSGIPNAFGNTSVQTFLKNMLLDALHDGSDRFMIHALEVGGAVKATYLGGIRDRRYFAYANSLAEDELTAHSPGDVLLVHLIEEICGKDCTVFDFGLGEERYKTAWATDEALADILQPLTLKGRAYAMVQSFVTGTKREIRQSERLWPMARKVRAIFSRLR